MSVAQRKKLFTKSAAKKTALFYYIAFITSRWIIVSNPKSIFNGTVEKICCTFSKSFLNSLYHTFHFKPEN